jgi:hypothetical protein
MSLFDPFDGQQTVCLACGTKQDMKNGTARGQCAHCYIGLLEGWHVPTSTRTCRYKRCGKPTVARDGAWHVCADHLAKRRPDIAARRMTCEVISAI